jgi:hypothetical protein
MKNPLKRLDVAITVVFFLLTIPAERFEVFSLLEDQTISIRQIFRTVVGDGFVAGCLSRVQCGSAACLIGLI